MESKIYKRLCFILVAAVFLCVFIMPAQTQARYIYWYNWWVPGSHSWHQFLNWADCGGDCNPVPGSLGVPINDDEVNIWEYYIPDDVTIEYSFGDLDLYSILLNLPNYNKDNISRDGKITLEIQGGTLNVGSYQVGKSGQGAVNQIGGTIDAELLHIGIYNKGWGPPSEGYYRLSGDSTVLSVTDEIVGGRGNGVFEQSGGTHDVGTLYIGEQKPFFASNEPPSSGTYNLSGGSLTVDMEFIGYENTGEFIQTGGTHEIDGNLYIGYRDVDTLGTYDLSSTGILSVAGNESIGEVGDAVFNQTGGTHTVGGTFYCDVDGDETDNTVTFNLDGGSLTVWDGVIGQDCAFNQNGGVYTDLSGTTLTIYGTYNWSGGELIVATINNYGNFNVSGDSGTERHVDRLILQEGSALNVSGVTLYYNELEHIGGTIIGSVLPAQGANNPPTADPNGPYTGTEGSLVVFDGSGSTDPDGHILTYDWDFGDGSPTGTDIGPAPTHLYADQAIYAVCLTVTDTGGLLDTQCTTANISNVAPSIGQITAPVDPVQAETAINTSAAFTDPGILDTHTAVWDWGDDTTSAGEVNEADGSGTATGSHSYSEAGVYTVTLTVTDDDGDSGTNTFQLVVIEEVPPTIDAILEFFKQHVDDGDLYGRGSGWLAKLRLCLMRQLLVSAGESIERDRISVACFLLKRAHKRCDGEPWPRDFVEGDATEGLAEMIYDLAVSLECEWVDDG